MSSRAYVIWVYDLITSNGARAIADSRGGCADLARSCANLPHDSANLARGYAYKKTTPY